MAKRSPQANRPKLNPLKPKKPMPISTDTPSGVATARYSLEGDEAAEARITDDQGRVAAAVLELVPEGQLVALVLTGAYGCGEGGSVESDCAHGKRLGRTGYDYLLLVRKMRRVARERLERQLQGAAQRLGSSLAAPVRFRLLPWEQRRRARASLERAELAWGCRLIAGEPEALERLPALPLAAVAPSELTLRMLEAGAGLLINQQQLLRNGAGAARQAFPAGDELDDERREGVIGRLARAVLACGDALLAMNGCYHPSNAVKLARLEQLRTSQPERWVEWLGRGQDRFLELYRFAYDYQLRGDASALVDVRLGDAPLADWQTRVRRLWLRTLQVFESERLGMVVRSWPEYCRAEVAKHLRTEAGALHHLVLSVRELGLANLLVQPRRALRSPQERLMVVLPMLLNEVGQRPDPCVCTALGVSSTVDWTQAATTFLRQWSSLA